MLCMVLPISSSRVELVLLALAVQFVGVQA